MVATLLTTYIMHSSVAETTALPPHQLRSSLVATIHRFVGTETKSLNRIVLQPPMQLNCIFRSLFSTFLSNILSISINLLHATVASGKAAASAAK